MKILFIALFLLIGPSIASSLYSREGPSASHTEIDFISQENYANSTSQQVTTPILPVEHNREFSVFEKCLGVTIYIAPIVTLFTVAILYGFVFGRPDLANVFFVFAAITFLFQLICTLQVIFCPKKE